MVWSGAHWKNGAVRQVLGYWDVFLRGRSRSFIAGFTLVLVVVLGLVDHFIGPELSFSVFYAGPIFLATWYGGKRLGTFVSFAAAFTWLTADTTAGHIYSHNLIPYWNTLVRLLFFIMVSSLFSQIKRTLDREEAMADSDALTGLANSRSFYEKLSDESSRSRRYGHPCTIAYIDLDNFKWVNDNLGHEAGDEALKLAADTIRSAMRQSDVAARLGGDEFATLYPETDFEAAKAILEKISPLLNEAMKEKGIPVTFSIGAMTFEKSPESIRGMVKAADDLMYQVKRAGKNNLVHRRWEG